MLELGVGSADITPPIGAIMDGFGARPGPADRVLDPLSVRALCFDNGARRFTILAFDLIGVRQRLQEVVRRALREEAGLGADALMLASTHTHAGPVGGVLQDLPVDEAYCGQVARAAVAAVRAAEADRAPVELDARSGRVSFPVNRRLRRDGQVRLEANPSAPVDREVRVLRAYRMDGSLKAAIVHASCHLITLPGSNTAISADYPGVMYERVAREIPGALAVFLLGSAGDVNPTVLPGEKPEETRARCGGELASVVAGLLNEPHAPSRPALLEDDACAWGQVAIDVPVVCPLSLSELEARAADFRKRAGAAANRIDRYFASRYANWYAERSEETRLDRRRASLPVTLQVFLPRRDILVAALPFEVFTATSQDLLSRFGRLGLDRQNVFTVSCANEINGYLPPASALGEGGYECEEAPIWYGLPGWYAGGAESLVRDAVIHLAERLLSGGAGRD